MFKDPKTTTKHSNSHSKAISEASTSHEPQAAAEDISHADSAEYIKIEVWDWHREGEAAAAYPKEVTMSLCKTSKTGDVCSYNLDFNDLDKSVPTWHPLLKAVADTADVKVYFPEDNKTINLPPQMAVNFIRFLKHYRPWTEDYNCFNFAVEIIHGQDAVVVNGIVEVEKHTAGVGVGKVIGLFKKDSLGRAVGNGHVAVSIGHDSYLSLCTDHGINVRSLESLKTAMDFNTVHVVYDASQGINLLSAQGQVDPVSIFHTAEKFYREIATSTSVEVPLPELGEALLQVKKTFSQIGDDLRNLEPKNQEPANKKAMTKVTQEAQVVPQAKKETVSNAALKVEDIYDELASRLPEAHSVFTPKIDELSKAVNQAHTAHESSVLGDAAHATANTLGAVAKGMHSVGKHIPGLLHKIEACAEIVADICHDDTTGNPVEDTLCGTLSGVTKVGVGVCAGIGLARAPAIAIPAAAGMGVLTAATLEAVAAGTLGAAAQMALNEVTKPAGDVVKSVCHAAFDYCRGDNTKPSIDTEATTQLPQASTPQTAIPGGKTTPIKPVTPKQTPMKPTEPSLAPKKQPEPNLAPQQPAPIVRPTPAPAMPKPKSQPVIPAPMVQPAPPPRPMVIARPLPPQTANFTNSLWAQEFQRNRYRTSAPNPSTTWVSQLLSKSSSSPFNRNANPLSPKSLYHQLHEASKPIQSLNLWSVNQHNITHDHRMKDAARDAMWKVRREGGTFYDVFTLLAKQTNSPLDRFMFMRLLQSTGLVDSHNLLLASSRVPRLSRLDGRDIGGVATEVSIIKGLRNSIDHAFIDYPRFCIKTQDGKLPFSHAELKQIFRELAIGLYVEQEAPFFSLHFNSDGNMYPVIHPVYLDSLLGYTIAKLDYDMKGFLQGSLFDAAGKLIDLQKYCRDQKLGFDYLSLRERHFLMTNALGLTENDSFDITKFQTSFRIIANQNRLMQDSETHAFIIEPDFEVQYTIDLTPEYQAEIERYRQVHGEYPPYYQAINALYADMAAAIKEQMPKLPICRDAFYRLGIISFFSYYLNTLHENGMAPKFAPMVPANKSVCPPFFQPIPIRYYKKEQLIMPLQEVMSALSSTDKKALNTYLQSVTAATKANEAKAVSLFEKAISAYIDKTLHDEANVAAKKHIAPLALELLNILVSQTQEFQKELVTKFKIKATTTSTFADLLSELKKVAVKLRIEEVETIVDWVDTEVTLNDAMTQIQSQWAALNAPTQQHPENQRLYQEQITKITAALAQLKTVIAQVEPEYYQRVCVLARRYGSDKKMITKEVNRLISLDQWPHEAFIGIQEIKKQLDDLISIVDCSGASFRFDVVYSTLEMPNSPTYHQTAGKSFQLIGGCSIRMPNRDLEAVALPSQWVGTLRNTFKTLAPENFAIVRLPGEGAVSGGDYAAFSMELQTKPMLSPLDQLDLLESLQRSTPRSQLQHPEYLVPLFQAVIASDIEQVRTLLAQGADVNVHLPDGLFPLYVAIQNGDEAMALLLIAHASTAVSKTLYFNTASERGENALHLALHLKQEKVANALIARGADFRLKQVGDGKMAIHLAAQAGLISTVHAILKQDPSLVDSALPSGETALHLAVAAGEEEMVDCLVNRYKAKVNGRNQDKQTSLIAAIRLGYTEIAALLAEHDEVESQAKPNYEALVVAATYHQWEIADCLLERQVKRIDPNNASLQAYIFQLLRQGQFARFKAIAEKNSAILELKFEGKSSLASACEHGHLLLMQYLQAKKVALVNPDKPDWTWIDYAVKANDPGLLRDWLATNKTNINAMKKLAYIAAEHNALACLNLLMAELPQTQLQGAYLGKSVFYAAIVSGKTAIVDAMIARYPTLVNEKLNSDGELPLLLAAKWGHSKIIKLLCRSGAEWYGVHSPDWEKYADQLAILLFHQQDVEVFKLVLQYLPAAKLPNRLLEQLLYSDLRYQENELLALMTPEIIKGLSDEAKTWALIRACQQGSLTWVKKMIESGAKPARACYKPSPDMVLNKTPLDAAVAHGRADIVEYLIPLVDEVDHYALRSGVDFEFGCVSGQQHPNPNTSIMNRRVANVASIVVRDSIVPVLRKHKLFPDNEKAVNQDKIPPYDLFSKGHIGEWNRRKDALFKAFLAGDEAEFTKCFIAFPSAEMSMGFYNDKAPFSYATQFTHDGVTEPLIHWVIRKNAFWAIPIMQQNGLPCDFSKDKEGKTTLHKIAELPEEQARQWISCLKENNWNFRFLKDKQGLCATDYALKNDRLWLLKEFCSLFSDPDKLLMYAHDGVTILHRACMLGKIDFVEYILSQGVSANIETAKKITPFMIAAQQGNIALMQLLLKHGANPNLRTISHDNALHIALRSKQEEAALWLMTVMAPSEIRRKDRDGFTPLMLAARAGLLVMTRHLVNPSEIARLTRDGRTSMHCGVLSNNPQIIKILASYGFDVDAVTQPKEPDATNFKLTPLHAAASVKKAQSFTALLEAGADPLIENAWQHSALWSAAQSAEDDLTTQILALPESSPIEQQEKLWFAAALGNNVTLLRQLCLLDFPIQSIDSALAQNALHKACSQDAIQAGQLLLAAGVDAELPDKDGNTPLHLAAQEGSVALVKALCERHVNVDAQNAEHKTPLHLAIEAGHEAVVLLLMKQGAKTSLKDKQGTTPAQSVSKLSMFKAVPVNAKGVAAVINLKSGNTAS